jgi:hypothetical protein
MTNQEIDQLRLWSPKDFRKLKNKWQSKDEFETVKAVRVRFERMKYGREHSCPFTNDPFEESQALRTTNKDRVSQGDWLAFWNRSMKAYMMHADYTPGLVNLKSSTTFATVEAFLAESINTNIGIAINPTVQSDKLKARVYDHTLQSLENIHDWKSVDMDIYRAAAIYGTAFNYNPYIRSVREVEMILDRSAVEKKMERLTSEKRESEIQEIEKIQKMKKPITEKQQVIDYDDVGYIYRSPYDIYVDENAWELHGLTRKAMDLIDRYTPSIDQFLEEFNSTLDPYILKENVKKVKPSQEATDDYGSEEPFFTRPGDFDTNSDKVEVLHYYNQFKDQYYIVANDILIRKGPIPYKFKGIPYAINRYSKLDNQLYGAGIPAVTERFQAYEESLLSLKIDANALRATPPIVINSQSTSFEDVESGWQKIEPRQMIEVGGDVSDASIRVLNMGGNDFGLDKAISDLREQSIMATGINAMQFSVPTNQPVRNNMMMAESTQKFIKKAHFFLAEGKRDTTQQRILLIKQYYPEIYEEIYDEYTQSDTKKYKSIEIEGYNIGDDLSEEPISGSSFLELKPEYLSLDGQLALQIEIDSLVPTSRAVQVQNIAQAFNLLLPVLSNPQLLNAPGVIDMVTDYVEFTGLSRRIIEKLQNEDSPQEMAEAEMENEAMMEGEFSEGMPGRSYKHIMIHALKLVELYSQARNTEPSPAELEKIGTAIQLISEHMVADNALGAEKANYAMSLGAQFQPQPEQPSEQEMMQMAQEQMPPPGGEEMAMIDANSTGQVPQI